MQENTSQTALVPVDPEQENGQTGKRFSLRDRIFIGLLVLYQFASVNEIAARFQCTPQYVRKLGGFAEAFFNNIPDHSEKFIALTPLFLERVVLTLSVVCQASLEDVSLSLQYMFGVYRSPSTISRIRAKYAARARAFNRSICFGGIWVLCSDEIFFGRTPVLATIDPVSTVVLRIMIAEDRTAKTWQEFMEALKAQGLDLKLSISDGGSGLLKGIKDAFENCFIQKDLFHNLKELGTPLYSLERYAYAFLAEYYQRLDKLDGPRPTEENFEKLADMEANMDTFLERVDELCILFGWIRELLGFTHYSKQETMTLITEFLDMMEETATKLERKRITSAIDVFRKRLPESLAFLDFLNMSMDALADKWKVDPDAIRMLYRLDAYPVDSDEYRFMSKRIDRMLGNRRDGVKADLDILVASIIRASSMIENLNSRLRTAFNDMRGMNDDFLELLHTHVNTKKYRRSNKPERVGKSPLELYNGDTRSFFDIIMPEWDAV